MEDQGLARTGTELMRRHMMQVGKNLRLDPSTAPFLYALAGVIYCSPSSRQGQLRTIPKLESFFPASVFEDFGGSKRLAELEKDTHEKQVQNFELRKTLHHEYTGFKLDDGYDNPENFEVVARLRFIMEGLGKDINPWPMSFGPVPSFILNHGTLNKHSKFMGLGSSSGFDWWDVFFGLNDPHPIFDDTLCSTLGSKSVEAIEHARWFPVFDEPLAGAGGPACHTPGLFTDEIKALRILEAKILETVSTFRRGAELYQKKCLSCHDGIGIPLNSHSTSIHRVLDGTMPPSGFPASENEEKKSILDYLRTMDK